MIRVAFALVALLVASQALAGERIKIVNDRRQVIGYIYKPCPTCRTQITDERRRIRAYIEPDGDIVDTRRRKILDLELEKE